MKTIQYEFEVIFTPQEEGGYTAEVPELPGCISEGETMNEAKENISEAIKLYLETLEERNIPLPAPNKKSIDIVRMTVTIDRDISEETHA